MRNEDPVRGLVHYFRPKLQRLVALVLALLLVVAVGTTSPARGEEIAFELRVEAGRLPDNMRLIRVKQGDIVTLHCTSDRPLLLHLHGYDLEWEVQTGAVATESFNARLTGRFPIHAHRTGPQAADRTHDEAPLANIEVYPR